MGRYVEDPDDPDHVIDLDEVDAVARARAERAADALPVEEARGERLRDEEMRATEVPAVARPSGPRSSAWILVLFALGLPFAVLVRVLTSPWRQALRHRARRRADRARTRALERAMAFEREAATEPPRLIARGLAWMDVGRTARAEAAFDAAVTAARTSKDPNVLAAALQNRGVARAQMRLPKLAAADLAERARLAPAPRGMLRTRLLEGLMLVRIGLGAVAGLADD